MSCQFSINYPGQKEDLIEKFQKAILSTGGQFNGDTANGVFEGKTPVGGFRGSYSIHGDDVSVIIDKKPLFVSCSRIEDEINNYLNKGIA